MNYVRKILVGDNMKLNIQLKDSKYCFGCPVTIDSNGKGLASRGGLRCKQGYALKADKYMQGVIRSIKCIKDNG